MYRVPTAVHGKALRPVQLRAGGCAAIAAGTGGSGSGEAGDGAVGSDAPHDIVERVGDVEVARGVGRYPERGIQLRVDGGAAIAGETEYAIAGDRC